MQRLVLTILAFWTLYGTETLKAAETRSYEVGAGLTSYQLSRLTERASGQRSRAGTSFYHLHLQYHQALGDVYLSPWLRFMPPALSSVESTSKSSHTSLMSLGLPVLKTFGQSWDISTGPVLLRYVIKGEGGLETLNNGESTSVFFKPGEERVAQSLAWQLGTALRWGPVRSALDLLVQAPRNSVKRSYSVMFTMAWAQF